MKSICFQPGKRIFYGNGSGLNYKGFNTTDSIASILKKVFLLSLCTVLCNQVTAREPPCNNEAVSGVITENQLSAQLLEVVPPTSFGGLAKWYGPYEYSNTKSKPFICPDQQVMKGRRQLNLKSWYLCMPLNINGIRVIPDPKHSGWVEPRQENSNWNFSCQQNEVMTGMQHWSTDESGYTSYHCSELTDKYSTRYDLYNYAPIEAIREYDGSRGVCPPDKVLVGRYYVPGSEITQYQCALVGKSALALADPRQESTDKPSDDPAPDQPSVCTCHFL